MLSMLTPSFYSALFLVGDLSTLDLSLFGGLSTIDLSTIDLSTIDLFLYTVYNYA